MIMKNCRRRPEPGCTGSEVPDVNDDREVVEITSGAVDLEPTEAAAHVAPVGRPKQVKEKVFVDVFMI
jgi:hypothetical protein